MPDKMTIKILEYSKKLQDKDYYGTIEQLLKELNINLFSIYLALRNIGEVLNG